MLHFLNQSQFNQLREDGEFLECKEVFGLGYWYGTLRKRWPLASRRVWVILEIDVQGAIAVLDQGGLDPITFVHTGGLDFLNRG